jgi:MFS family permease
MNRVLPWLLVALCFAIGVASRSVTESFSIFLPALEREFAGSRSALTLIYSLTLVVNGLGAPVAGWIVDRFGVRMLPILGMTLTALATASASFATELWHLYLGIGLLMGTGGAMMGGILSASLLGRWFPARRLGVALAVAWSAPGVGAIVVYPLAEYMIATQGWRHAWLVFAIAAAAFVPMLLVLPWKAIERGAVGIVSARASTVPGMTVGEAVREWPFWALTGSFALTSVGVFSLVPQSMAYLLERGFAGGHAARALAIAGFLTPLGMVGFSWLADRGGRRLAALLAYSCSVTGVGALALVHGPADEFWLWVYVLLFGGSQGSRGPMISTLATLRYRGANFGRIYGAISIGMGVGCFFGAWVGGLLHDWTGGYAAVLMLSAGSLALAAVFLGSEAGARERIAAR